MYSWWLTLSQRRGKALSVLICKLNKRRENTTDFQTQTKGKLILKKEENFSATDRHLMLPLYYYYLLPHNIHLKPTKLV